MIRIFLAFIGGVTANLVVAELTKNQTAGIIVGTFVAVGFLLITIRSR